MVEVFSMMAQNLEMFMLVVGHRINVHHKEVNLTYFYSSHKIWNENILSLVKFDQNINKFQ